MDSWVSLQRVDNSTLREIPIFERVFKFYANLLDIDHTNKIQDPENPNLERYLRFENDPAIGWSLVGSGTKHKYLLYFNSQFPFVHQNFVNLNLGILTQLMPILLFFKLLHKDKDKRRLQKFNSQLVRKHHQLISTQELINHRVKADAVK